GRVVEGAGPVHRTRGEAPRRPGAGGPRAPVGAPRGRVAALALRGGVREAHPRQGGEGVSGAGHRGARGGADRGGVMAAARRVTRRCEWGDSTPEYRLYHDREWGVPVHDDRRLFEFLILEGAQAGLSWITILRKRAAYRSAFSGFDPRKVA